MPDARNTTALRLQGTFTLTGWDENTIEEYEGGGKMTHASVAQEFSGDVEGDGVADWVMAYRPDGTARFLGLHRVRGSVGGNDGSFVLETVGEFDGQIASWTATIVNGTGTGALQALEGGGSFRAPMGSTAEFTLDFELSGG